MINITEDRLRWLVQEQKHLTLDGAVEIAKGAPDLLKEIARLTAERDALREVAKGYEQWEADLILLPHVWEQSAWPLVIPWAQYDRMIELQTQRNSALGLQQQAPGGEK